MQGPFINIDRLDLKKYAQRPALAKVLCDYVVYQLHNPRKGLELCALATQVFGTLCDFVYKYWRSFLEILRLPL